MTSSFCNADMVLTDKPEHNCDVPKSFGNRLILAVKTTLFEDLVQKWTIGDVLYGCVPSNFRKSFRVRTWAKHFALSDRLSLTRWVFTVLSSTSPYSSVLFLILHPSFFNRSLFSAPLLLLRRFSF
jgi:hypothetical protein